MRNLPTLQSIAADPGALTALSLDTLDALIFQAEAENKMISAAKRAINGAIEARYADAISAAYRGAGKDFGTVRIADGAYEIVADTPKKVEWSQAQLAEVRAQIAAAGDDPDEYIRASLTVDERAFTAWPTHIRTIFEPARTTKPGTRTIKLQRKDAA